MLKRIKFKNSVVLLIGISIIFIGIGMGFYEYFIERKEKAFSDMNIMLFEHEIPKIIVSEDDLNDKKQEEQVDPPDNKEEQPNEPEKPQSPTYNYIGVLEIPKINIKRGFLDLNSRYNNVDYNITLIAGSTFPNEENNNLILAAHSGNCTVCFFDQLYKLQRNDMAYVYYHNIKYAYKVVNIYEVPKVGKVAIHRDYNKNTLTLITCTRNSNTKQTVYILELTNKESY